MQDPQTKQTERFVWPPRKAEPAVDTPVAEDPSPPSPRPPPTDYPAVLPSSAPEANGASAAEFVIPAPTSGRGRRFLAALRSMMHDAERTWLDVRAPVLHERIDELAWNPDDHSAYCWKCGQGSGPNEISASGCSNCEGTRPPWKRIIRLGAYRPPLTHFVHEVKFTRWRRLGNDLGAMLGDSIAAAIARERQVRPNLPTKVVVVPVPTTIRRRMWRGIDHSQVIAAAAARRIGAKVLTHIIGRKHRKSQLLVLPSEREANMADAFFPRGGRPLDPAPTLIVVIDDVTTTGATLRGACRAVAARHRLLGGKGTVEVWAAVVAATELQATGTAEGP